MQKGKWVTAGELAEDKKEGGKSENLSTSLSPSTSLPRFLSLSHLAVGQKRHAQIGKMNKRIASAFKN